LKIYNSKNKKKIFSLLYVFIIIIVFIKIIFNSPGTKGSLIDEIIILTKQPYILNDVYNHEDYSFLDLVDGIFKGFSKRVTKFKIYDKIYIDMPFDQYQIIKLDRKDALIKFKNSQYLSKKNNVNAKIRYKNKNYKVRIRLKGDRADHWGRNKRFSFNVRLQNDKTLLGYRIFSITNHKSRSFPQNEVISKSINRLGLQTPSFRTVNVIFNGDDWGLMYIEEQFSSNYFEKRKIKQVPIARLTSQEDARIISEISDEDFSNQDFYNLLKLQGLRFIKIYNKKNYKTKLNSEKFISLFKSFNLFSRAFNLKHHEKKNFLELYNKDKFAILLAYNAIFNDWHSTDHANIRYYFNPYLGKIEPVPTDFLGSYNSNNYSELRDLSELKSNLIKLDKIFFNLFDDKNFQANFYSALGNIKKDLPNMKIDIQKLCQNFTKECLKGINFKNIENNIGLLLSNRNIFQNINNTRKNYYSTKDHNSIKQKFSKTTHDEIFKKITNHVYFRIFEDGNIYLENISNSNITVTNLSHKKKKWTNDNENCQSISSFNINLKLKSGQIEERLPFNKKFIKCLELDDKLNLQYLANNKKKYLDVVVENKFFNRENFLKKGYLHFNFLTLDKYIESFGFIKEEDNYYIIKEGKHIIDKPLYLKTGKNLIINADTVLTFTNQSFIYIKDANLIMNGTANKNIVMTSPKDSKWGGILVSNSKNSIINFVKFENTDFYNDNPNKIFLTGAINFFKSNVRISNVEFNNSIAEDSLNLIETSFLIENSSFKNSISDALDIDFSKGKILNSQFSYVKGDSIDTSGSHVELENIHINETSDKAISVGENSKLFADNIKISNSFNSIAVKDDSSFVGQNIFFENNITDVSAYLKKSYYNNGGNISLKNIEPFKLNILKDKYSYIKINDKEIDLINYEYN